MKKALLMTAAATLAAPVLAMPNLLDTEWKLVSPKVSGPVPTLSFQRGQMSGFAGCNRYVASSNQSGQLRVVTTRMMCPPEQMKTEQDFVAFLSSPFRMDPDGHARTLRLISDQGEYRFERVEAKADKVAAEGSRLLYVGAERKPCTGVAPMQCLQVREDESKPWQHFYGAIEGFDPQPGSSYLIRVRTVPVKNPPADAPSTRTILDKVIYTQTMQKEAAGAALPQGRWAQGELVLTFDGDRLHVKAGCNGQFGPARLKDGRLEVGPLASTMMACAPEAMARDGEIARFLGAKPTVQRDGDTLKLSDGKTTYTLQRQP